MAADWYSVDCEASLYAVRVSLVAERLFARLEVLDRNQATSDPFVLPTCFFTVHDLTVSLRGFSFFFSSFPSLQPFLDIY